MTCTVRTEMCIYIYLILKSLEQRDQISCYLLLIRCKLLTFFISSPEGQQQTNWIFFHKYGKNVFSSRGQRNYVINFNSCFLWPFFFLWIKMQICSSLFAWKCNYSQVLFFLFEGKILVTADLFPFNWNHHSNFNPRFTDHLNKGKDV